MQEINSALALFDQIEKRQAGDLVMSEAQVELTHRCNLRCVHCYLEHKSDDEELDTAGFKSVIDQLAMNHVFFVAYTGGEILMRKDWLELLTYTRDKGLFFGLQTNGTLINEEVADAIFELNPTKVEISLHGACDETHDRITQVPSSFQRVMTAFKLLKERNIRAIIKTTVMSSNMKEIPDIQEIVNEFGFGYQPDPLVVKGIYGSANPWGYAMSDAEFLDFMRAVGWGSDEPEIVPLERKLVCRAGKTKFGVSPQGEVFPCIIWRIKAGDLKSEPLSEIWTGPVLQQVRQIGVQDLCECRDCSVAMHCVRCPGAAFHEHNNNLAPSSQSCRLARLLEVRISEERLRKAKS